MNDIRKLTINLQDMLTQTESASEFVDDVLNGIYRGGLTVKEAKRRLELVIIRACSLSEELNNYVDPDTKLELSIGQKIREHIADSEGNIIDSLYDNYTVLGFEGNSIILRPEGSEYKATAEYEKIQNGWGTKWRDAS